MGLFDEGVSFGEFAARAKAAHYDVDELVDLFKGKLDGTRDFFERVFQGRYSEVVIPYRSVLEFYQRLLRKAEGKDRACRCGCGVLVVGQRKFASEGCRKRLQRAKMEVKDA